MRLRSIVVSVVVGCSGTDSPTESTPASFLEVTAVEGLEVVGSVGVVPHEAVVRAVNRFGASVPSERSDALTLDDVPIEVLFDGFGYGGVELLPGTRWIAGAGDPVEFHTVASDWPGAVLQRAWLAPVATADMGVAITTGGVIVSGSEVWWAGEGAAPHRVLSADEPIVGIRSGNIDVDGVTDALVWTTTTVFLLRGRPGGGLAWGAALEASGMTVGGTDIGDLSADNLPDLAVAWIGAGDVGTLDIWEGDGLFRFVAAEPRDIPGRATSVLISDNTGEGLAQVTVLQTNGEWSRFIRGAELAYMPIGPATPTGRLVLPEEATLMRTGDINTDQADEIAIGGPRAEGVGRNFWFVDVKTDAVACAEGEPDAECTTTYLPLENEAGAWAAMADGNGDFLADIFLEHDTRRLYAVAWDPLEIDGEYRKISIMDLPTYGPMDLTDFDRDGEVDLFLAGGPVWWRYYGQGDNDLDVFWGPRESPSIPVRETLDPPFAFIEIDGRADTLEVVGFTLDAGRTLLKVVQYTQGGGRAPQLGDTVIDPGGSQPTDIAVCGYDVYVAVGGDVHRLQVRDVEDPDLVRPVIAATVEGTATRIECGIGPNNTQLAVLDAGEVQWRRDPAMIAIDDPIAAPGAVDLAFGDFGAGPVVETCETPECSVVFWQYGEARAVFAKGDPTGITVVDGTGAERSIGPTGGQLSVADLDEDGHLDLLGLSGASSLVTFHRSTGTAIAPAELFHNEHGWVGAVQVRDADGDGHGDLWALDLARDLVHTVSPVAPTATGTAGTSTGDTGGG